MSFVDTFDYYNEDLNEGAFMDDNTSMYYAVVYWQSPKQQNIVRVYEWPATKQTITIKDSILVKKGMQSGQWEISKIFIQNRSPESEDEGTTLAVKNGTEKEQLEKGDIDTYYTDLSVFDFTVTDVSKKADDKAPTIVKKSLKVSKTKIKKNKKSTFSVQVKDASGIESVTCIWGLKGKHDEYDSYKKMKYNKKTKKYECKIKLTKNYKRARLLCIITKDIYGNEAYYSLENPTYKKKYKKAFSNVTVYRK